jgi:hypothetical protein
VLSVVCSSATPIECESTNPNVKIRNVAYPIEILEVRAGIEPTFADLQSAASPLCHRTWVEA